jgi:hypothetical protein
VARLNSLSAHAPLAPKGSDASDLGVGRISAESHRPAGANRLSDHLPAGLNEVAGVDLIEYRVVSAAGTPAELPARLMRRTNIARNLAFRALLVCRTVPRLATGNLRFSYPQTLSGCAITCRRLPVATRASASLSEASVRLPFLPSLTAEGRCGMDSTESQITHVPAIAESRRRTLEPVRSAEPAGRETEATAGA